MKRFLPGAALTLGIAIAIVAYFLGRQLPLLGGPVLAVVIGMIVRAAIVRFEPFAAGVGFSSKGLLQISIVLLGLNLSLEQIGRTGLMSLPVMLGTLVILLVAAYPLGRMLRVGSTLRTLITVGTTICGASAIAAVSLVTDAAETEIAYAIATVFLFNIVAVFVFPLLGHAMQLSDHAFGLWAGTAINDTSSVVAAGFSYSPAAGNEAVIVKLTRTTLIVPIVLALGIRRALRTRTDGSSIPWREIIPWFIVYFVLAAALNSVIALPPAVHVVAGQLAVFLIIVALAGVGLSADFKKMRETGPAPVLLGLLLWVLIALSSLAIARAAHLA